MKNEMMLNRSNPDTNSSNMQYEKPPVGSTEGKYPVKLNDGRTVIFISDKSKESEIRQKYELQKDTKFPTRCPRHYR